MLRNKNHVFHSLIVGLILILWAHGIVKAQSSPDEVLSSVLLKPEESKSGILVLEFGTTGLTSSAARSFSNMIARNLQNTHRFEV
ncbi:MAG: hypothetical protein OEY59_04350, partial [Deltaproteobacteria bacterium]|nr:hypothetical protein [Deltaproteobacteria bacterium]